MYPRKKEKEKNWGRAVLPIQSRLSFFGIEASFYFLLDLGAAIGHFGSFLRSPPSKPAACGSSLKKR